MSDDVQRRQVVERVRALIEELEMLSDDELLMVRLSGPGQQMKAFLASAGTASRSYSDEIVEALKLAARRLDAAADRSNEDGDVAAAVGYRTWAQEALAALKVQTGERHGQSTGGGA